MTHLEALLGRELGRAPGALEDGAKRPVAWRHADDSDVLAQELIILLMEDIRDLLKDGLAVRLRRRRRACRVVSGRSGQSIVVRDLTHVVDRAVTSDNKLGDLLGRGLGIEALKLLPEGKVGL